MYKPVTLVKNIIVGAGPAGLQLAYYFEKSGIDYIILEQNALAGSFFDRYPLTNQLISINKRNTGSANPEFNLRHDWNSLLSDDGPKFTDYSTEFYPDRKDLVRYMNDFAAKYAMKIKYSHSVKKIRKIDGGYSLDVNAPDKNILYACERLIIATGLGIPNKKGIIDKSKRPVKHYAEFEKNFFANKENLKQFENKTLAIIGNGNSAYELGNILTPVCSSIAIICKKHKPMAMSTHYAGDLRSIYLPFIDTFTLKSLNAIDQSSTIAIAGLTITQETPDSRYILSTMCGTGCNLQHPYLSDTFEGFDNVILCTGWKFDTSIFDLDLKLTINGKYPHITGKYESVNNEGLFFIGALMHSHDYKQSSGGFIHGFRYLIKYFFNIHYKSNISIKTFQKASPTKLVSHIVDRLNTASSLYQMYSNMVDIFIINTTQNDILYIEDVTQKFAESDVPQPKMLYGVITLEYGLERPVTDMMTIFGRDTEIGRECKARYIHPVIRVYREKVDREHLVDEIHFDEDLFAKFTDINKYTNKLLRALKMFL
jgi:thioredoxin reductase